jgi:hypothetical protein
MIIKDWLFHFITTGVPPEKMAKAAEVRNQQFQNNNKNGK